MAEKYQLSINLEGQDILVEVGDLETANLLLNDHIAAVKFIEGMNKKKLVNNEIVPAESFSVLGECSFVDSLDNEIGPGQSSSASGEYSFRDSSDENEELDDSNVDNSRDVVNVEATSEIWTKKKKTDIDNEATSVLLALRQKYWKQFDDKKTNKRKLWNLISQELIKKNFNVGENGGEKCRQKFCNLTKMYYAYIKNQKTTGEAGKDEPQFFQQMHSILGAKHKAQPVHLEDSIKEEEQTVTAEAENSAVNRFSKKPKLKPTCNSDKMLQELQRDRDVREKEFDFIQKSMKTAERQRDRFLRILEKAYGVKEDDTESESS